MINTNRDPSSFRDPAGYVFTHENRIYRRIDPSVSEEFLSVHNSGLLQRLIRDGKLLDYSILSEEQKNVLMADAAFILEHPKIPFISYSYEWSFKMLQQAALLQLELHLQSLKDNVTLIDATPFNIQFMAAKPCFIDHLSFRPYVDGDIWWGHQLFCQQFLTPLLLQAYCKTNFQAWLKGSMGTIPLADLYQLLPWKKKFNWRVFLHLGLQTKFQSKTSKDQSTKAKTVKLPKAALINLLSSMQTWVEKLSPAYQASTFEWQFYDSLHLYSDDALSEKKTFVAEFCQATRPNCLWDLGCNQGEFASLALENSAGSVLGFDIDPATIDKAFSFAQAKQLHFQPLVMDFTNPTSFLGWNNKERKSLSDRNNADAIIALALIHHIRFQHNVPLAHIVDYLLSLAPAGVIEFIPKSDPKVQWLLKFRQDIFADYDYENFIRLVSEKASIIKTIKIKNTERQLIWYKVHA